MEKAIKWFSRNHVAGNFLMLVILLTGFATWFKIRKEVFPETSVDIVSVQVPYPNATPEEVERGVCVPIEEAISDLEGIDKIRSTASQNIGVVNVEIANGYELRNVMDDVKTRVDAIDNFAEEAERPVLEEVVIKAEVMSVTVTANTDEKTLRRLAERVRDDLLAYEPPPPTPKEAIGGLFRLDAGPASELIKRALTGSPKITQVQLANVRPYEISIEVEEDTLRAYGLTLDSVARAVRRTSLDLPGGSVRTGGGEVIIRAMGKGYVARDFENIVVTTLEDGSVVRLNEIATVIDGFEQVDLSSSFDGQNAIVVKVFRTGEQDTLQVAEMTRRYIEDEAPKWLPEGVGLEIWNDQSSYLKGRLNLLVKNAGFGLFLVLIVLALFLRPSLAALVAIGIPVSFAGGILMMPELGVSINMISLFAFILVLGIVVDDAIVVGENVYTRIQSGEDPKVASWKGTHEVGVVVIFGILTTMMAFTPMLGLSGVSGKIWPNIPLIVIPVLAFSLLQSKFVLPAHLALLKPTDRTRKVGPVTRLQRHVADGLERFIHKVYQPTLSKVLRWRWAFVGAFTALLFTILGLVISGRIKSEFFPKVEGDIIAAKLEMPLGAPFAGTEQAIRQLEQAALEVGRLYAEEEGSEVLVHVLASAGTQPFQTGFDPSGPPVASHLGEVTVELAPAVDRKVTTDDFIKRWREVTGPIPGAVNLTYQAETAAGGNAIDVNLVGPDLDTLIEAVNWSKESLGEYSGVVDIADSNRAGKRELQFTELTPAGRSLGFKLDDVARQVRDAFYGNEVQRLQRDRDELKVMVRYPEEERESISNLERLKLRAPDGSEVPLLQVAVPEPGRGPSTITRTDRMRSIRITADVDKSAGNANEIAAKFTEEVINVVGERFPGVTSAFEGEQEDQNNSIREMMAGFLFALLGMYVLMAVPLRSYIQPMIVMSVIPFGLVGAVLGHILLGLHISIMSMCGIVALAGVVVNDSLVLVDYVNRHLTESNSIREAAERAGTARFRAILLTSLTTFAGLMPMLLETDIQAKFLIPMAVSLAYGILFATLITLFLVPCVYLILEDFKWLTGRLLRRLGLGQGEEELPAGSVERA